MGEAGGADAGAVAHGAAVTGQVITVKALGALDQKTAFARRDHRAPGHAQEMVNQGLNILQGPLLGGWAGQRVVRLVGACGHVVQTLADDAQALAHFLDAHQAAIVHVAVVPERHLEVEVVIARVGACLAHVVVKSGGPQARAGHAPGQGLFGVVLGHADTAQAQNAIVQGRLLVFVEPWWQPVDELPHQLVPAAGQVGG